MSWQSLSSVSSNLLVPGGSGGGCNPHQVSQGSDELSSASEISGLSLGISVGDAPECHKPFSKSSMVVETVDDLGLAQHYLIPNNVLHSRRTRNQLKRKGTKLRIFLDHVFVSRRPAEARDANCPVCSKRAGSRLGRKVYICRDCDLTCHKACYEKVNEACPRSSVAFMEL